jgi:excisionase family DNA binding protein
MFSITKEKREQLLRLIEEWMGDQMREETTSSQVSEERNVEELARLTDLPSEKTKGVFTVKELSDYLCVSLDSIYAMVREKQIPFVRIRRRILFYRDSIDNWLKLNGNPSV